MPWITVKPPTHVCAKPSLDGTVGNDSLWKCDECERVWRVVDLGDYYPIPGWATPTARQRRELDL
jgi:hypothetical protein